MQLPKSVLAEALGLPSPLYPQSSAPIPACGPEKPWPNLWMVPVWEISQLRNCHIESRTWVGKNHLILNPSRCKSSISKVKSLINSIFEISDWFREKIICLLILNSISCLVEIPADLEQYILFSWDTCRPWTVYLV